MIKKLKRKFIIITMGSLALVMIILIGFINVINLYNVDQKVNDALQTIAENEGKVPDFEPGWKPPNDQKSRFFIDEETRFKTRYFVVKVNENKTIGMVDTGKINAVEPDEAIEYAKKAMDDNKTTGYRGVYKYIVAEDSDNTGGSIIVFIYCKDELQAATDFLWNSIGVAAVCYLLMFILVSILSKKAINPIIESMEKQKQFITDAGHEIKTPLAIISANADVLEVTGGKSEWITSIRNQTIRLDKLVKNLLMLSKMGEDSVEMVFSEFDLSETVFETAAPFEIMAGSQNKKFEMDIQPGLKLNGDQSSINQLVSTLVDNAIKYSKEEGSIKISLSSTKKGVKIEVFNTTDEIPKENLDKLFDRFYRADSSRSRDTGGYGIGLSIAKSIVEAHHGKITAKSEDGTSICFIVLI